MDLEFAKTLLNECERHELRDHAFGDVEYTWVRDGKRIMAHGYSDGQMIVVSIDRETFSQEDSVVLAGCGRLTRVTRNDVTGPDDFEVGRVGNGLTKEGVHEELTRRNVFDETL